MNLSNYSAALIVKDINRSRAFYQDILGLEIQLDFGKNIIFKSGFSPDQIADKTSITVAEVKKMILT